MTTSLHSYEPKIEILQWKPPKLAEVKPPAPAPEAPKTRLQRVEPYLPTIVAVFSAVLGFLGIFLIARALGLFGAKISQTVTTLGEEGLGLAREIIAHKRHEEKIIAEKESEIQEITTEPPAYAPPSNPPDTARNVNLVRHILKDNRALFAQVLTEEEADLKGVKWLLPLLTSEEQPLLRQCLGIRRLSRLSAVHSATSEPQEMWLQGFVERLMLQKLVGGSKVEKALGPEFVAEFSLSDPETFVLAVQEVNQPAARRIHAEFVSKEHFADFLDQFNEEQWKMLISSAEVQAEEIKATATRIGE